MRLTIHNVGHGGCITLLGENGNSMMWDCGHRDDYRPSVFLPKYGIDKIDLFFITNYDEDHISDLPQLIDGGFLPKIGRNTSIDASRLRDLKRQSGPISCAMESMLKIIQTYTPSQTDPNLPSNVTYTTYCNTFDEFEDTNNCSLVTFLNCNGCKCIIPGDVEKAGWLHLLENPIFRDELKSVNIFIASHHGRESGYCEDVFDLCSPAVVIFSDSDIQYATQEMSPIYRRHCSGMQYGGQTRYVLSTRHDGHIWWDIRET